MRAAVNDAAPALVLRSARRLAAVPLEAVTETMRPLPIDPMPGTSPFVRGVSVVRAEPVPVLDLGALLGGESQEQATRFVTLRSASGRIFALAVGDVLGIRQLSFDLLHELSPVLGSEATDLVSAMTVLDQELVVLLRSSVLVPPEVWQALDAHGAGG